MQVGAEQGMITFENYVTKLFQEGKIAREDAETYLGKRRTEDSASRGGRGHPPPPRPSGVPVNSNSGIKIHGTVPSNPAASAINSLTSLVKKKVG
jgi:hypothetical protein